MYHKKLFRAALKSESSCLPIESQMSCDAPKSDVWQPWTTWHIWHTHTHTHSQTQIHTHIHIYTDTHTHTHTLTPTHTAGLVASSKPVCRLSPPPHSPLPIWQTQEDRLYRLAGCTCCLSIRPGGRKVVYQHNGRPVSQGGGTQFYLHTHQNNQSNFSNCLKLPR